jgi:hypothetical protein
MGLINEHIVKENIKNDIEELISNECFMTAFDRGHVIEDLDYFMSQIEQILEKNLK